MIPLEDTLQQLVRAGKLEQALRRIHDFVERIITEPRYTAQIFSAPPLDALCLEIGRKTMESSIGEWQQSGAPEKDAPVVYVATKLQKSGGHSRVIEDLIRARPQEKHVILLTGLAGKSDTVLTEYANVEIRHAPRGCLVEKLTWLQRELMQLAPSRTYLFNHHADSVAVAALIPGLGGEGWFYHHGDHHLCLGVHLRHLRHIDPHPMGYHYCRDTLDIDNFYIPLVVEDKGARPVGEPFMKDGTLTTCTAARANKLELPYFVTYAEVVSGLLKATGGRHVHIGHLSPWTLRKIRASLKRDRIPQERFVYIPWVKSVWLALLEHRVDVYLASFPEGGGLTLIEAMGAGVPAILHRHIFSRLLCGIDLAYPEAFSWRTPEELFEYCRTLTPETLVAEGKAARKHYETFHQQALFLTALANPKTGCAPPPMMRVFTPDTEKQARWVADQFSWRRRLRASLYRTYRKLRSRVA